MTLSAVVERLRKRMVEFRYSTRFDTKINATINSIEMSVNLTELAIDQKRAVMPEEEIWFHESWNMIHRLERTEWEDIIDLYRTLEFKIKERNWFR